MSLILHGTNGVTYPDGKVQLGAAALEQVGMITHTSDTALATVAAGGTQIGSAVSMVVPSAGVIRVTVLEMEFDETEGGAAKIQIGLKTGSDSIMWAVMDKSDGTSETIGPSADASTASILITNSQYGPQTNATVITPFVVTWDIAGRSITAGTVDVEVWLSDNVDGSSGEATITGTTVTARFLVEVVDGT